jgi:hypothetical protein
VEDVLNVIADCIHPAFRKPIAKNVRAAVRACDPRFRFPDETVEAYLQELCNAGAIAGTGWGFELGDGTQDWIEREQVRMRGIDHRRSIANTLLDEIWEALPPNETIAFDIDVWRGTPIGTPPMTPLAIVETGRAGWISFERQLRAIAAMTSGEEPASPGLGLPIEDANKRAVARRQSRLDKERCDRIDWLTRQARHHLGRDADAWLAADRNEAPAARNLAARDDVGLSQAQAALAKEVATRERAARAAELTASLQAKLSRTAVKLLQPKYVELFLNSTDPELGCAPLARCTDDHGYALARARLDQATARQRRGR